MYPISFFKQRKKPGTPEKKEALGERASAVASSLIPPNPLVFIPTARNCKGIFTLCPLRSTPLKGFKRKQRVSFCRFRGEDTKGEGESKPPLLMRVLLVRFLARARK